MTQNRQCYSTGENCHLTKQIKFVTFTLYTRHATGINGVDQWGQSR